MSAGFVEVLLKWRYHLQSHYKESDLVIEIPHEAWDEFVLAMEEVFEPIMGPKMAQELFLENKVEIKVVGFMFRRKRAPFPSDHPLMRRPGWDGRFT